MSQRRAYDDSNIFAKILRGEMPARTKIYEDEATLAIMDMMPRGDGHSLVVPKKPVAQSVSMSRRVSLGRRHGDDPEGRPGA